MELHILSMWQVAGGVDEDTPTIVLKEIAYAHQLGIDRVLVPTYISFHLPLRDSDLEDCIRFVNPMSGLSWTKQNLRSALEWYIAFDLNPELPVGDFYYGMPSPDIIKSYSPAMLYRVLKDRGIKVPASTTLPQLSTLVNMLIANVEYNRDAFYTDIIRKMSNEQLLKCFIAANEIIGGDSIVPTRLEAMTTKDNCFEKCLELLNNREFLLNRIVPETNSEAILLAAKLFRRDITLAADPVCEYAHLKKCTVSPTANGYFPLDAKVKELYLINSSILDLETTFNPHLPEDVYRADDLKAMALNEGYSLFDLSNESAYSLLQTVWYSNTFYHGSPLPGCEIINTTTVVDDDPIDQVSSNALVCYGTRERCYVYKYKDLEQCFAIHKYFKVPCKMRPESPQIEIFDKVVLQKLRKMCDYVYRKDTPESIEARLKLKKTMIDVEFYCDAALRVIYNFKEMYTPETKVIIEKAIHNLFLIAMAMRGWTGEGAYPIEDADVKDSNDVIEVRVTIAYINFEATMVEMGELAKTFLGLPLIYHDESGYIVSSDTNEGLNIGERLEIARAGETHANLSSCIRLTSNWFAATVYRVCEILGLPQFFDITKLGNVS
jgi:hypothetical protein